MFRMNLTIVTALDAPCMMSHTTKDVPTERIPCIGELISWNGTWVCEVEDVLTYLEPSPDPVPQRFDVFARIRKAA